MSQTPTECCRVRHRRVILWFPFLIMLSRAAAAQTPIVEFDREQPFTVTIDADTVNKLPTSDSLFGLLETSQPSIIPDRFSNGGLALGQPTRISSFFGSWSQTEFRIGDVRITDPSGNGFPLAFTDVLPWKSIAVSTGLMHPDLDALGLAVTLTPMTPTDRWTHTVDFSTSHGGMNGAAQPIGAPPAITRLGGWDHLGFAASGPLSEGKIGGAFTGAWSHSSEFIRVESTDVNATAGLVTAALVFTPHPQDTFNVFTLFSGTSAPFTLRSPFGLPDAQDTTETVHGQLSWDRRRASFNWHTFGGYTYLQRNSPSSLGSATIERLSQGPIDQVASLGSHGVGQWTAGTRLTPVNATGIRKNLEIGVDASGARESSSNGFSGSIGELVDGIPSRIWEYSAPAADSLRHETTIAAYLADHFPLTRRLTLDASLGFDAVFGSARDAASDIRWGSWEPRAFVRWTQEGGWKTETFLGIAGRAYQLPLNLLSIGDPAASTANVYRWDATGADPGLTARGPLIARVGPGTGGSDTFMTIDANLKRPYTDEFGIGLHTHPRHDLMLRIEGTARRQRNSLGLVNVGVTSADYTVTLVPDIGSDELQPGDDRVLSVYNRTPASFGNDRYVLTNPGKKDAWSTALELGGQVTRAHYSVLVGASANFTEGVAASRGYGPLENDAVLVGETFTNPNAEEYSRGRLFSDRGLTGKIAATVHLPWEMTLGTLARYQDGQMFARMLVTPGLNQGADFVRAFTNGGSLFHFIGTFDLRLQKTFMTRGVRLAAMLEAFLPLGPAFEVEENVANGPGYRDTTAVAPPHRLQVGLRMMF